MKYSIIAPMFNEEQNLHTTLEKLKDEMLNQRISDYEIIFVNDGSTDATWTKAKELEKAEDRLKVIGYTINQGRGKALRTGIDEASGEIIITIDFDLSYDAAHISRMIQTLDENPVLDIVLVSAYMPGGKTIGVSKNRLLISKLGNILYRYAFSQKIYTSTCVVRAYRKDAIKTLLLESDDKEIHLEILSKALANGFKIKEIPGTLTRRKAGKSKFKFKATSISHLIYLLHEKPILLFGFLGFFLTIGALLASLILVYTRFSGNEAFVQTIIGRIVSPSFVLMLYLFGLQFLAIGFLGIQNTMLKRELFKIQAILKKEK